MSHKYQQQNNQMKEVDNLSKELRHENESLLSQLSKERNALDKLRLET